MFYLIDVDVGAILYKKNSVLLHLAWKFREFRVIEWKSVYI